MCRCRYVFSSIEWKIFVPNCVYFIISSRICFQFIWIINLAANSFIINSLCICVCASLLKHVHPNGPKQNQKYQTKYGNIFFWLQILLHNVTWSDPQHAIHKVKVHHTHTHTHKYKHEHSFIYHTAFAVTIGRMDYFDRCATIITMYFVLGISHWCVSNDGIYVCGWT